MGNIWTRVIRYVRDNISSHFQEAQSLRSASLGKFLPQPEASQSSAISIHYQNSCYLMRQPQPNPMQEKCFKTYEQQDFGFERMKGRILQQY